MDCILIVDDDKEYLSSLGNVLKADFEVVKAVSLSEAKDALSAGVKVALVDIRLDEKDESNRDGLRFLEWLKMNRADVPVVIMSAYSEFDLAVDALNLGAAYFLKKPINLAELTGILKGLLAKGS